MSWTIVILLWNIYGSCECPRLFLCSYPLAPGHLWFLWRIFPDHLATTQSFSWTSMVPVNVLDYVHINTILLCHFWFLQIKFQTTCWPCHLAPGYLWFLWVISQTILQMYLPQWISFLTQFCLILVLFMDFSFDLRLVHNHQPELMTLLQVLHLSAIGRPFCNNTTLPHGCKWYSALISMFFMIVCFIDHTLDPGCQGGSAAGASTENM